MTDTTDLVARLRSYAKDQGGWHNIDDTCEEAADTIERLTRERDEAVRGYRQMFKDGAEINVRADAAEARADKLEADNTRKREALSVMTALVELKYGNIDADVWGEILKARDALEGSNAK